MLHQSPIYGHAILAVLLGVPCLVQMPYLVHLLTRCHHLAPTCHQHEELPIFLYERTDLFFASQSELDTQSIQKRLRKLNCIHCRKLLPYYLLCEEGLLVWVFQIEAYHILIDSGVDMMDRVKLVMS